MLNVSTVIELMEPMKKIARYMGISKCGLVATAVSLTIICVVAMMQANKDGAQIIAA